MRSDSGHLKHPEAEAGFVGGKGQGLKDDLDGLVKCGVGGLAFNRIVQDAPHAARPKALNGGAAFGHGFATTKLAKDGGANKAFDGKLPVKRPKTERFTRRNKRRRSKNAKQ